MGAILRALVRRVREEKGMTREDLARRSGVSRNAIARLELGEREPSVRTLAGLARALGIQPEALGHLLISDYDPAYQARVASEIRRSRFPGASPLQASPDDLRRYFVHLWTCCGATSR
jgi:transcriptional regulator with XRE-family HTH domain